MEESLEVILKNYNRSNLKLEPYQLEQFWRQKDQYGLVNLPASRPLAAILGNWAVVYFNENKFPWGYLYGFFGIEDKNTKHVEGIDDLIEIVLSNNAAVVPAIVMLVAVFLIPILICVTFCMRNRGLWGGEVVKKTVAKQKKLSYYTSVAWLAFWVIIAFSSAIEFSRNGVPLLTKFPQASVTTAQKAIFDLHLFIANSQTEMDYFFQVVSPKLIDSLIHNAAGVFNNISNELTDGYDLNTTLIGEKIKTALKDEEELHRVLLYLGDYKSTIEKSLTTIYHSYQTFRFYLFLFNQNCTQHSAAVSNIPALQQECSILPVATQLPEYSNINFDQLGELDTAELVNNLENVSLETMLRKFEDYNHTLIDVITSASLPFQNHAVNLNKTINMLGDGLDLQKYAGKAKLNDTVKKLVDGFEKVSDHWTFNVLHVVVIMVSFIPIFYSLLVGGGTFLGWYSTRLSFPCYIRGSLSTKHATNFILDSQYLVVWCHWLFALLFATIVLAMSVVTVLTHNLHNRVLITRIVDRIPDEIIKREIRFNITDFYEIKTKLYWNHIIRTCEDNGGLMDAVGIEPSDFDVVTEIIELVPWPDPDDFGPLLESLLSDLENTAIPVHGSLSSLDESLETLQIEPVNYTALDEKLEIIKSFDMNGQQYTITELKTNISQSLQNLRDNSVQGSKLYNDSIYNLDMCNLALSRIIGSLNLIDTTRAELMENTNSISTILNKIRASITSLYAELENLIASLRLNADRITDRIDQEAVELLNQIKLTLREKILFVERFMITSLLPCRVVYDIYDIVVAFLHVYIVAYLNGFWLACFGICMGFMFPSYTAFDITKYFMKIKDHSGVAPTLSEQGLLLPPSALIPSSDQKAYAGMSPQRARALKRWRKLVFRGVLTNTLRRMADEKALLAEEQQHRRESHPVVMPNLYMDNAFQSPLKYMPEWAQRMARQHEAKPSFAARVPGTYVDPEDIDTYQPRAVNSPTAVTSRDDDLIDPMKSPYPSSPIRVLSSHDPSHGFTTVTSWPSYSELSDFKHRSVTPPSRQASMNTPTRYLKHIDSMTPTGESEKSHTENDHPPHNDEQSHHHHKLSHIPEKTSRISRKQNHSTPDRENSAHSTSSAQHTTSISQHSVDEQRNLPTTSRPTDFYISAQSTPPNRSLYFSAQAVIGDPKKENDETREKSTR